MITNWATGITSALPIISSLLDNAVPRRICSSLKKLMIKRYAAPGSIRCNCRVTLMQKRQTTTVYCETANKSFISLDSQHGYTRLLYSIFAQNIATFWVQHFQTVVRTKVYETMGSLLYYDSKRIPVPVRLASLADYPRTRRKLKNSHCSSAAASLCFHFRQPMIQLEARRSRTISTVGWKKYQNLKKMMKLMDKHRRNL